MTRPVSSLFTENDGDTPLHKDGVYISIGVFQWRVRVRLLPLGLRAAVCPTRALA